MDTVMADVAATMEDVTEETKNRFWCALRENDKAKLTTLAEEGVPIERIRGIKGRTGLHQLAALSFNSSGECVAYLIDRGADVSARLFKDDDYLRGSGKAGDTPLILAAREGRHGWGCMRALISGAKRTGVPVGAAIRNEADENALFALIGNTNGSCEDEMHPNFEGMFKLIAAEMTTEELSEIGGSGWSKHALLHALAQFHHFEEKTNERVANLLRWLVTERGMDINALDYYGKTPLIAFLDCYHLDQWCGEDSVVILTALVELGADLDVIAIMSALRRFGTPSIPPQGGRNVLHVLAVNTDFTQRHTLQCLEFLIEACDDDDKLRETDEYGRTPFDLACSRPGPEAVNAVRALTPSDIDPDDASQSDRTLFGDEKMVWHRVASAATAQHIHNLWWSLDKPSHLDSVDERTGRTVLHAAAAFAAPGLASFYLRFDKKLDVNAKDKKGKTPLHLVVCADEDRYGWWKETILELLRLGADPLVQDEEGQTPLEACGKGVCAEMLACAEGRADWQRCSRQQQQAAGGLASFFSAMRADGRLLDVAILCGGETFRAHAAVLAAKSDYWSTLFFGPMARPDGQYTLEEVSPEVLAIVIDFCYSEALPAPEALGGLSVIASLMHAAGFLLSAPLRRACLVRALGTLGDGDLDIKGVFEIYEAACTHRDMESVNAVQRCLQTYGRDGRLRGQEWLRKLPAESALRSRLLALATDIQDGELLEMLAL